MIEKVKSFYKKNGLRYTISLLFMLISLCIFIVGFVYIFINHHITSILFILSTWIALVPFFNVISFYLWPERCLNEE